MQEDAFEYPESLRSRGFLDQLGTEAALRLNGVTDDERQRVQELSTKISAARKDLEQQGSLTLAERDEERYKKAGEDLAQAEKELATLDNAIGKRLPAYAQLRNPKPVDVKTAQKWCGKDRAVLEYVLWNPSLIEGSSIPPADIGSWCIILTEKKVKVVKLDGDYDYATAINKLREGISNIKRESQLETVRNELYDKLLASVLSKVGGSINELVIVPDGCLSFLPFDVLRKNEKSKCLGDQYVISFSPSVSVSVLSGGKKRTKRSVLAFGGAWYDSTMSADEHRRTYSLADTSRGVNRGSVATDFRLEAQNDAQLAYMKQHIREYGPGDYFKEKGLVWQDLPGTVTELAALRSGVFAAGTFTRRTQELASEAMVKKLSSSGDLKRYSVLHFACHGYFDSTIADMSSVLFSEVSGKLSDSSSDDGYLTIPEAAVLNLDADMVCLSACETGLGEVRAGDGMVGLSRAFMVAGAEHVGVSLWCVDDEATAEFMTRMYRKVEQEGMDYAAAYRAVKAEFRKSEEWDHPYYWAAFVLYE